ncbi:emp24/gp25L/p24 family/GOLD-domain-containing protein [Chlamydoabsidia padenii]|nr:emp24/gp25L/p24 family/GOLD-domain-containing protein [Chlamydoabsidia padenii]
MPSISITLLIGIIFVVLISAIKFDIRASPYDEPQLTERCFSHYVPKNTKVLVTATISEGHNQHVDCDIYEDGEKPNVFAKKRDIKNDYTSAFDTLQDGEINICFSNTLDKGFVPSTDHYRSVDLEVNTGAEAKTIEEITRNKHLPDLEEQTRVLEAMVGGILNEMNYLKDREAKLRNTNGK